MREPIMSWEEAMEVAQVARQAGFDVGICDSCHVVRPNNELVLFEDNHEVLLSSVCKQCTK
jgi:hypothetical protein